MSIKGSECVCFCLILGDVFVWMMDLIGNTVTQILETIAQSCSHLIPRVTRCFVVYMHALTL